MNQALIDIVQSFDRLRVAVFGDVMLDEYVSGRTQRLCQEAPVPVVDLVDCVEVPGGAANTAMNLRSLGAVVRLVSVAGDDDCGARLTSLLAERQVDAALMQRSPARLTLRKRRISADGQLLARVDSGSTVPIGAGTETRLIHAIGEAATWADVCVISDYGYGVMTDRAIDLLAAAHRNHELPIVVDAKRLQRYRRIEPTAVKPNFAQLKDLLPETAFRPDENRWQAVRRVGPRLLDATGARIVAATLDRDGALILSRDAAPHRTFCQPLPQSQAAGAGDTFLSALALALAAGAAPDQAGEIATAAACLVVGKPFTAVCSQRELLDQLHGDAAAAKFTALASVLDGYRRTARRLVLTNGCFDILHPGHIAYLQQARSLGDVLIVGVNTDAGIRRLKGPGRPINTLEDRLKVLAALSCIDHLVAFDEETPHRLIEVIRPDVFVKGGDYTRETLPEADLVERLGGCVKILPFLEGRSTTGIISRIAAHRQQPPAALAAVGDCP